MPLAIVHDYLNQLGGAEKVLSAFLHLVPNATVYTSVARPDVVAAGGDAYTPVSASASTGVREAEPARV